MFSKSLSASNFGTFHGDNRTPSFMVPLDLNSDFYQPRTFKTNIKDYLYIFEKHFQIVLF